MNCGRCGRAGPYLYAVGSQWRCASCEHLRARQTVTVIRVGITLACIAAILIYVLPHI